MDLATFTAQLESRIGRALLVADRSPDVRDEEVELVGIVALVQEHPEHRHSAESTLVDLVGRLNEDRPPSGLVELLGFCVHVLGLPEVVATAKAHRAAALVEDAAGHHGWPYQRARAMELVIDADNSDWEDADMFVTLNPATRVVTDP